MTTRAAERAAMLEQLFRDVAVGIAVLDRDLRFVMVNEVVAELNGRSIDDHAGRSIDEVIPKLASIVGPILRGVLETGEPVRGVEVTSESRAEPDVQRHWLNTYTPIRRDGEIVAVGVLIIDRTAQREAEDALRKSETQFRAICEFSPVGIFVTDPTGSGVYHNPEGRRQMALPDGPTSATDWRRGFLPEDAERIRAEFRAATSNGGTWETVERYRRPDGDIRSLSVKANGVYDGDSFLGYLGMVEDITERLAREEALHESELRFRELAENIDSIFWLADAQRVYYVSPAFEKVWGRTVAELLANRSIFLDSIHPDDRARVTAQLERRGAVETEYRIVRPDGSIRWIDDRVFPVRDANGETGRKAGIATDITKQKELEAKLLLSQKLDSIGRLAGGIAHDFNNLLGVILNQTQLALRAQAEHRSSEAELAQIADATRRAAELTHQLLTFARKQPAHPAPLDPTEVAEKVEQLLRRLIGETIRVVTRLDPDVGIVRGDRTQLEQVLVNLVVNARDAMPNGGELVIETANTTISEAEASRAGCAPGSYVVMRVSDTGRGIPHDDQTRVFEPFFTTKDDGTGLGLATCYGIVQQHGGHIEVESAPERGATFSVYLPRIDERTFSSPASSTRILVVDDDPARLARSAEALRKHGFHVVTAPNLAEAALRTEDAHQIDLVVVGFGVPRGGAREIAAALRRKRPAVPILFTSASPDGGAIDVNGVEGAAALEVPFVATTLVRRVCDLLPRRSARPAASA